MCCEVFQWKRLLSHQMVFPFKSDIRFNCTLLLFIQTPTVATLMWFDKGSMQWDGWRVLRLDLPNEANLGKVRAAWQPKGYSTRVIRGGPRCQVRAQASRSQCPDSQLGLSTCVVMGGLRCQVGSQSWRIMEARTCPNDLVGPRGGVSCQASATVIRDVTMAWGRTCYFGLQGIATPINITIVNSRKVLPFFLLKLYAFLVSLRDWLSLCFSSFAKLGLEVGLVQTQFERLKGGEIQIEHHPTQ